MCVNKEDADRLFLVVSIGRMRGEGHKYKNSKFHLNIHTQNRKKKKKGKNNNNKNFTARVVECWNGLQRVVVEFPFLEILKTQIDMAWSNLL